jgi:hypothetical protein
MQQQSTDVVERQCPTARIRILVRHLLRVSSGRNARETNLTSGSCSIRCGPGSAQSADVVRITADRNFLIGAQTSAISTMRRPSSNIRPFDARVHGNPTSASLASLTRYSPLGRICSLSNKSRDRNCGSGCIQSAGGGPRWWIARAFIRFRRQLRSS